MPIIPRVGRRSPSVIAVIAAIYVMLCLGSFTMIYPFCMMLTGSISSRYDYEKYHWLPTFIFSKEKQFCKFLFEKYGERYFTIFASTYGLTSEHASWRDVAFDDEPGADEGSNKTDFVNEEPAEAYYGYAQRPEIYEKIAKDFYEFKETLDPREIVLYDPVTVDDRYWRFLKNLYMERTGNVSEEKALIELRKQTGLTAQEFRMIVARPEVEWMRAHWFPSTNQAYRDWVDFKSRQEKQMWCVIPTQLFWQRFLAERYGTIAKLRERWGYAEDDPDKPDSFWRIPFLGHTPNVPGNADCEDAHAKFIRYRFPRRLITLSPQVRSKYRGEWIAFVIDREHDTNTFTRHTSMELASFDDLELPGRYPENSYLRSLWVDFLLLKVDPADYTLNTTEDAYRSFLLRKYGSLDAINSQYDSSYASLSHIPLPAQIVDVYEFNTGRSHYFWHYMARNYRRVFEFLVLKGRALFNTVVLVTLTIVATLTVNPMAAYALSRYSMRSSHRILIFFLATMAFPPGVTMIPNFLLMRSFPLWQLIGAGIAVAAVIFGRAIFLKNLPNSITFVAAAAAAGLGWMATQVIGNAFKIDVSNVTLLNTYAALIVPGLANGFAIFLLKGFFDSLPRELYEAGMIDGASEFTMFRTITLPLCKPILAVIALQAFTAAYSGFMWAFIVCQKQSMWTIMVWLYQFQQRYTASEPWLVMASLVVVSVPTLLMFLFCQRIILRGIIIPTMK